MSPFNSGNGKYKMSNMNVTWNGMIASDQSNNANGGIRPVISLKSTVKSNWQWYFFKPLCCY